MTHDPNGWPDPMRRGVPMHPEMDGWHWLRWDTSRGQDPRGPVAFRWERGAWLDGRMRRAPGLLQSWTYLGPCLTPAEVAAREAAAAEEMLLVCVDVIRRAQGSNSTKLQKDMVEALLPTIHMKAPDALARARAEAKRAGMEEAAKYLDGVARSTPRWGDPAEHAAAIRARMEESNAEG